MSMEGIMEMMDDDTYQEYVFVGDPPTKIGMASSGLMLSNLSSDRFIVESILDPRVHYFVYESVRASSTYKQIPWSQRAAWAEAEARRCLERLVRKHGQPIGSPPQAKDGKDAPTHEHSVVQAPVIDGTSGQARNAIQEQAPPPPGFINGSPAPSFKSNLNNGNGQVPGNAAIARASPGYGQAQPVIQPVFNSLGVPGEQFSSRLDQAAGRHAELESTQYTISNTDLVRTSDRTSDNIGFQSGPRTPAPPLIGMPHLNGSFGRDRYQGYGPGNFPHLAPTMPTGPTPPLTDEMTIDNAIFAAGKEKMGSATEKTDKTKKKKKLSAKAEEDKVKKPGRKQIKDSGDKKNGKPRQRSEWRGFPFLKEPNKGLTDKDWQLLLSVSAELFLKDIDDVLARGGNVFGKKGRRDTKTLETILRNVLDDRRIRDRNLTASFDQLRGQVYERKLIGWSHPVVEHCRSALASGNFEKPPDRLMRRWKKKVQQETAKVDDYEDEGDESGVEDGEAEDDPMVTENIGAEAIETAPSPKVAHVPQATAPAPQTATVPEIPLTALDTRVHADAPMRESTMDANATEAGNNLDGTGAIDAEGFSSYMDFDNIYDG